MKKVLFVSAVSLFTMCCQKTDWNRVTVLEIKGESKREIIPEYFELEPRIDIFSNNSKRAYDSAKCLSELIIKSINKIDSLATVTIDNIDLSLTDRWGNRENVKADYKASVGMTITSKSIHLISEMITACITNNATEIGLPTLKSYKTDSISDLLRKEAYNDALRKAEKSAKGYGAYLGKIVSMRSTDAYPSSITDIENNIFGNAAPKEKEGISGGFGSGGFADLLENKKLNLNEEIDLYYELKWK
jgi:uncharacterized protein YggE